MAGSACRCPGPRSAPGTCASRPRASPRCSSRGCRPGTSLSVTLLKGQALTGVVRDGNDNRPLAERSWRRAPGTSASPCPGTHRPASSRARTDREGRFRLEGLASALLEVSARAPRYGRVQRRNLRPGASVEFLLFPGASISGTVIGPDARPVAGAVLAAQKRGPWGFEPAGAETTDARGRFTLAGVEPATYLLVVRHPDLAPATAEVTVEPLADAQVEIALARGAPVLGRLVAGRDQPVAGKVSVEELSGRRVTSRLAEVLRAETGPDGLFVIDRLPPGSHALVVRAPGFGKRRVEFEVGARAASVDLGEIALDRGLVIAGKVQSRGGGRDRGCVGRQLLDDGAAGLARGRRAGAHRGRRLVRDRRPRGRPLHGHGLRSRLCERAHGRGGRRRRRPTGAGPRRLDHGQRRGRRAPADRGLQGAGRATRARSPGGRQPHQGRDRGRRTLRDRRSRRRDLRGACERARDGAGLRLGGARPGRPADGRGRDPAGPGRDRARPRGGYDGRGRGRRDRHRPPRQPHGVARPGGRRERRLGRVRASGGASGSSHGHGDPPRLRGRARRPRRRPREGARRSQGRPFRGRSAARVRPADGTAFR